MQTRSKCAANRIYQKLVPHIEEGGRYLIRLHDQENCTDSPVHRQEICKYKNILQDLADVDDGLNFTASQLLVVGELAVANLEHVLKFKDNHALADDWIVTMCRRVLNLCWGFKQGRKKQHRWAVELLVPEEATQRKDEVDRKKSPEKKKKIATTENKSQVATAEKKSQVVAHEKQIELHSRWPKDILRFPSDVKPGRNSKTELSLPPIFAENMPQNAPVTFTMTRDEIENAWMSREEFQNLLLQSRIAKHTTLFVGKHVQTNNAIAIQMRWSCPLLMVVTEQKRRILNVRVEWFGRKPLPKQVGIFNETVQKCLKFMKPLVLDYITNKIASPKELIQRLDLKIIADGISKKRKGNSANIEKTTKKRPAQNVEEKKKCVQISPEENMEQKKEFASPKKRIIAERTEQEDVENIDVDFRIACGGCG